jgi:hypothetical protein
MNLDSRAINAVGRITNPWNEPRPTPDHVKAQQAAIGHLVVAACRGVESLGYLAAIDEERFGGRHPVDGISNASVDDGHVRWAVASAISTLDQCTAAASRFGSFRSRGRGEHSVSDFYAEKDDGTVDDRRNRMLDPWRAWFDGIVADQHYVRVLRVRHCLIHSDARRGICGSTEPLAGHGMRFRYMVAPPAGTMLDPPVEDVRSREVIELACVLASTHVVRFVETVEQLPPQPRP